MGRKPNINIGECCPNCSAVWGLDEMQQECCFCCGYPDNDAMFDDFDDDDDDIPGDGMDEACEHCGLTYDHSISCKYNK